MASKKIKFVQLEPNAFLSDSDFQAMNAESRGVYWTLLLYLYTNNGRIKLDFALLAVLCACADFKRIWLKIKKKFLFKNGLIEHKTVNAEIKKARQYVQIQRRKGLKGANRRWHSHSTSNSTANGTTIAKEKKTKVKESKLKEKENNKEKVHFLDFVLLTSEQYSKLVERFGEGAAKEKIERLNNYIGSSGKKYKSHYHTILAWSRNDPPARETAGQRLARLQAEEDKP